MENKPKKSWKIPTGVKEKAKEEIVSGRRLDIGPSIPPKVKGEVINKSPLPEAAEPKGMNFFEALKDLQNGVRITRIEWADKKVYGVKKDGFLMLHKADDKFYNWIISEGDMDAKDWIRVK